MQYLGYSTGAIALGDFARAIDTLRGYRFDAIELSALRFAEVEPLINAVPHLDLLAYRYISFHAPSSFPREHEQRLVELLTQLPARWPIVLHPDAIYQIQNWLPIAGRIAIENMDRRKNTGRNPAELRSFLKSLPGAKICLDLGHARQVDSSMVTAYMMLSEFKSDIVQLHVSEVDTFNRHESISKAAERAFLQVQKFVPKDCAIILESRVSAETIGSEAEKVRSLFPNVGTA